MTLKQRWDRISTLPTPKRPLRQLFLATALSFFLGLIIGPFAPTSWAYDNVPIRFDLPFRFAFYGGFCSFVSLGGLQLSPVARKVFFVLVLAMLLPLVAATGVLLHSMWMFDLEASGRFPSVWFVVRVACTIMFLGAGTGWFRYFQMVSRRERNV